MLAAAVSVVPSWSWAQSPSDVSAGATEREIENSAEDGAGDSAEESDDEDLWEDDSAEEEPAAPAPERVGSWWLQRSAPQAPVVRQRLRRGAWRVVADAVRLEVASDAVVGFEAYGRVVVLGPKGWSMEADLVRWSASDDSLRVSKGSAVVGVPGLGRVRVGALRVSIAQGTVRMERVGTASRPTAAKKGRAAWR